MSDLRRRIDLLRERSLTDGARLAFRKLVYREVRMDRVGMPAGDATAPSRPCAFPIELWGPDRYDRVLHAHPYLTTDDLEHFHRQRTTCIVVLDGDRIAANTWMTGGDVYVHELQRPLAVPHGQHFSCRTYVSDDYRGQSLMGHMISTYSASVPADDEVWGLVYAWNTASLLSLERLGWMTTGEMWTRFVFGRPRPGERRFPPRRPTETGVGA